MESYILIEKYLQQSYADIDIMEGNTGIIIQETNLK
jgi:hypothetical protein